MKNENFINIIKGTPTYVPMFELVRTPKWLANHGFEKGDLFYFDAHRDSFVDVRTRTGYNIGSSALKFIEYKKK